jgi:hypothetical protein
MLVDKFETTGIVVDSKKGAVVKRETEVRNIASVQLTFMHSLGNFRSIVPKDMDFFPFQCPSPLARA